jgi:multiple sugar transport system substrate-binding protein
MKHKVSIAICFLACALTAAALASCAKGKSSGPVKVSIFVGFGTGTDTSQVKVHEDLAKEFNASHKDIQIEFTTVQYDEHDTKFTAMLSGGMSPDLVMPIGVMGVATYQDEWLDLAPYIKKDKYDLSDFYGQALDSYVTAGKTIGVPIGVYPSVMYYNADLFDKGKQKYPTHQWGDPSWTNASALELAKKLTVDASGKRADQPGFNAAKTALYGFGGWEMLPWRVLPSKFGGDTLGMSADLKKAEMNSPEWKAAARYQRDLIFGSKVRPKSSSESGAGAFGDASPIGSGKCAFWESHSWMQYEFEQWSKSFSWDVAAIPAGPSGKIVAELNADTFAIPKSSKHPAEAWTVAKWFMQPEIMTRLTASYGCIPARKTLAEGWLGGMKKAYPKVDWQVFIDSMKYVGVPNYEAWVPAYKKVWDAMENFQNGVTTGAIADTDKGLENLSKEVQGYLDEYWKAKK